VLVDVLAEYGRNRFGQHRVEHLLLAHLMRAHQVEFQLAERRCIKMTTAARCWALASIVR
jgi:hypothetical protein